MILINFHVIYRGKSTSQKTLPFRNWYANLKEIKSLLSPSTRYAVFTATATKETKRTIFQMLELSPFTTFVLEKPPLRGNISYHFCNVGKDTPLDVVFGELLQELQTKLEKTDRCIIFCQTRKQCSTLYRLFTWVLGPKNVCQSGSKYDEYLVPMFHAGSPESVKTHVVEEMTKSESKLRVLICTIAFGMGINCKNVYRSIHFGPSSSLEALIQETGRLGRDGKQCLSYILYNGLLLTNCDGQVRDLVEANICRQVFISRLFEASGPSKPEGCLCCDVCSKACKCVDHDSMMMISFSPMEVDKQNRPKRHVSKTEKDLIRQKLLSYRASILPASTNEFIPVGSTNVLFEFDHYQINQILENCCYVFTMDDLLEYVELWRNTHANNVMDILAEVFDDVDPNFDHLDSDTEEMDIEEEDWKEMMDGSSSTAELFDDSKFANMSRITVENSELEYSQTECSNVSGILYQVTEGIFDMTH